MSSPIYSQIATNKRRTVLLVVLFTALTLALGWIIGELNGTGVGGLTFAGIFAILSGLFSYFSGDRMALWSAGAIGPVTREQEPYVVRMVENLSIASGLPLPKIYLINDNAINAFATGRDPAHASIAVTRGALQKLENEELEGVLAHELSHVKNYDILVMTLVVVLVGTVALLSDGFFRARLMGGSHNERDRSNMAILLFAGAIFALLAPLVAELIKLAVSRRREYLADASGALLTRYPEGLARALEKIASEHQPLERASHATAHLFFSNPFGGGRLATWFATHPPIADRIRTLRSMTA